MIMGFGMPRFYWFVELLRRAFGIPFLFACKHGTRITADPSIADQICENQRYEVFA